MTGVSTTASDRKTGLTLGEIALWVEQARLVGLTDDTRVQADSGFRSQLLRISTRP